MGAHWHHGTAYVVRETKRAQERKRGKAYKCGMESQMQHGSTKQNCVNAAWEHKCGMQAQLRGEFAHAAMWFLKEVYWTHLSKLLVKSLFSSLLGASTRSVTSSNPPTGAPKKKKKSLFGKFNFVTSLEHVRDNGHVIAIKKKEQFIPCCILKANKLFPLKSV